MGINVAIISTYKQRCGIASYTENLANALAKQDANVYIVRIPRFGIKDPSIFQNILDSIPIDKIDLIHCQNEYGLYTGLENSFFPALKRLGKPIVTTMHSVGNWEIDGLTANTSDKIIVHNEFCHKRFGYPEKTCIIPHGLTPLQTPPPPREACKKRFGIQPQVPIVGYLGYISSYKGLETLIQAMTKVPNAALIIGGGWFVEKDTQYIVNLKEWTLKALPNRCQWLGYVEDEDLSMVYGLFDILCYPSRFATESGALLEGLSHECATIASAIPPFKEKEKQGALMTFKNTADLTCKIKRLLKDSTLRTTLSKGAKQYAERNAWFPTIATKHIKLYEQVLANSKKEGNK